MAPVEHGQLQTAVLDPDSRPAKTKQALDANTPPDAMTTIQVPSDFLLKVPDEHKIFEIEPKAPYLVPDSSAILVIWAPKRGPGPSLLRRRLESFRVLYVPGNHEAHQTSWEDGIKTLNSFEDETKLDSTLTRRIHYP